MVAPSRRGKWIGGLVILGGWAVALIYGLLTTSFSIGLLALVPGVALVLGAVGWPRFIGWLILAACVLYVPASFVVVRSGTAEPEVENLVFLLGLAIAAPPALAGYLLASSGSANRSD